MKRIVLSGINLFSGGTLEIYKSFLREICKRNIDKNNSIVAFVYKKELFNDVDCSVEFIEIPDGRNYIRRMYYENIFFYEWSKDKEIDIWIAMHDITPRVVAKDVYTYYHTPQIFYDMPLRKAVLDPRCYARTKFYKFFVGQHINDTTAVIIQANWIERRLKEMFPKCKYIVARPEEEKKTLLQEVNNDQKTAIFFYPSFPRVFKNFEVICKACAILNNEGLNYKALITLKGNENRYAKWLYRKYGNVKNIEWLGVLPREEIERYYASSDVLVFPSELETWGLPITEWGTYNKPVILADLPYAHETSQNLNKRVFFRSNDEKELAGIMKQMIRGDKLSYINAQSEDVEYGDEWGKLLSRIIKAE